MGPSHLNFLKMKGFIMSKTAQTANPLNVGVNQFLGRATEIDPVPEFLYVNHSGISTPRTYILNKPFMNSTCMHREMNAIGVQIQKPLQSFYVFHVLAWKSTYLVHLLFIFYKLMTFCE